MKKTTPKRKPKSALELWLEIPNNKILVSVLLPIIGWFIGFAINPGGWLSSPATFLIAILIVPVGFWFVALPTIAALIYVAVKMGKSAFANFLLIVGVIYSILVVIVTAGADEEEFA